MDIINIVAVLAVLEPIICLTIIAMVWAFKTKDLWAAIHMCDLSSWNYIAALIIVAVGLGVWGLIVPALILFVPLSVVAVTRTYYELGCTYRKTN